MLQFSLPRSWFCCLESETYATYVILPGNHLSWNNDCSRRMQHKKNISLGCFTKWLTKKSVKTTDSSNLNVCQSNLHEKQLHCFTKWGTQHCNQKFLKFFWLNEKLMVFSVKRIDYQVFQGECLFPWKHYNSNLIVISIIENRWEMSTTSRTFPQHSWCY